MLTKHSKIISLNLSACVPCAWNMCVFIIQPATASSSIEFGAPQFLGSAVAATNFTLNTQSVSFQNKIKRHSPHREIEEIENVNSRKIIEIIIIIRRNINHQNNSD